MTDFARKCFVCGKNVDPETTDKNPQFNLPVCDNCKGTDREKEAIAQLLEGMAEGFVCGCI
jgi:NAD-dependent SIR2 family protein deacetylase